MNGGIGTGEGWPPPFTATAQIAAAAVFDRTLEAPAVFDRTAEIAVTAG
jgi:hypothetical protein